ncbi:hypothetical protein VPH35_075805 [Triticum aestivum]
MAAFLLFLLLALAASHSEHEGAVAAADDPPAALTILTLRGSPRKHLPGRHEHLIPTSKTLLFGSSYSELIGGLVNLPGLALGRDAMMHAVRVLSAYDPAADAEPVKRALAAVKVMICEAGRLKPVRETVSSGWDSESRVAPEHLPYIEHWDTMSYEIIRANRTGKWEDGPFTNMLETQANIHSKEEAVAVMNVLMDADFEQVLKAHTILINLQ